MRIEINRTGRKIEISNKRHCVDAFEIIKAEGYERVNALDVENGKAVQWEGIEFNRLFIKDGIFYRFNEWLGEHPYKGVEIEEIGLVNEAKPVALQGSAAMLYVVPVGKTSVSARSAGC